MVKQTTSRKAKKNPTQSKSKKTKNFILRDHNLDLIIQGKRKRIPTQRALEAQTLLHNSKKIKKVAPKIKRLNTMQKTAKEALEFLHRGRPIKQKISTPIKISTKGNDKTVPAKSTKSEKSTVRGRSKNESQVKTSTQKATESKDKKQSKSTSRGASTKKGTKTITKTPKDVKEILGTNNKEEKKPEKKNIFKRTKTMEETLKEGKAYLKPLKSRSIIKKK